MGLEVASPTERNTLLHVFLGGILLVTLISWWYCASHLGVLYSFSLRRSLAVANVYMCLGRFLYRASQQKLYNKPLSPRSHTSFPIQIGLGRGRDVGGENRS